LKRFFTVVVFVAVLLAQATLGSAAGFLIYEHGAAAMGMAGAFVSVANDPSAIFHNPAGIAFLKGTQVSVGTTLISSTGTMTLTKWPFPQPQKTWEQEEQIFYPSTVYLTQSIGDRVTLGFGFFSPYGLGASWPEENQLRYLGYKDDMKTFFLNPTVGVKLTDQLSVGAGVSVVYSTVKFWTVELAELGPFGDYDVPAVMEGKGYSWSVNAGLLYRAEKFSVGFNWRSGFDLTFSGDLTLDTSAVPGPFKPFFPTESEGETTFKFPHILGVGVSFTPTEKLLLSFDFHRVLWSRFDEYVVTFDDERLDPLVSPQNWKDSSLYRLGGQYMISPRFALRAGFLYDVTPQPVESMDPLLPDANRYAITGGFGWTLARGVVLDVTFHHEIFEDRTSPNRNIPAYQVGGINIGESDYEMTANLLGISLNFSF
jgi:long-chain fatty acid transport protein